MKILVIAPHPDDEVLGCGGTLLRRKAEGATLGWLIVTSMAEESGWARDVVERRETEIARVAAAIGFAEVFNLRLAPAQLDRMPMGEIVARFATVFKEFLPEEILVPNRDDVHTDHRIVFDAAAACSKWFRHPSVRRVLSYETLSETEFGLSPDGAFRPNSFVDISDYVERKLEIMSFYASEVGAFPFPRSLEAIRALAELRGSTSGCRAAEAFQLLRERQ